MFSPLASRRRTVTFASYMRVNGAPVRIRMGVKGALDRIRVVVVSGC
jgi:hypothetical protein